MLNFQIGATDSRFRLATERIVGAFVFPEVWANPSRFKTTLGALRECGVNAILTESDAYDRTAIDAAHGFGLRFYAGLACFSDHASNFQTLAKRPELWPVLESGERRAQMEWYIGISPSDRRHQQEILAEIALIARTYPIDGLFLDFVRWPIHWEIELRPGRPRPRDSSFDATTLAKFAEETGFAPPPKVSTTARRAAWIHDRYFKEWVDFKCKVVTDFVGEARTFLKGAKSDAEFGVYVVPDVNGLTESLTGQRIRDLAPLVDWVSPMLYHNILLRPTSWIGDTLASFTPIAARKTLPVVQADSNRDSELAADWGPPMSDANWNATLAEIAMRTEIAGLVVFPGASIIANSRGQALRSMVNKWR
jgi:hypothetical protein